MALKNSDVIKYSLYSPLSGIGLALTMSYLTVFQTEGLGWTAALATTVLIVPRIVDFIGGAICGSVIAKANMKWGKYRSWFVVGGWVVWAGIIMMFLNTGSLGLALPLGLQILIAAVGYSFQNVPMNFIQTSQYGLMALMAGPDMNDRIKLSVWSMRLMYVGTIVTSVSVVPLLAFLTQRFGARPGNPSWYHPNAYTLLGIVTATVFLAGTWVMASATKKFDQPQPAGSGGAALPLGELLKGVVSNDQLLIYVLVNTIATVGMFAALPLGIFYFMFVLNNMMLQPVAMTISTLFGLVAAMIGPAIGQKLGKKRAMQIGMTVSIVDSVLIALLAGNTGTIGAGIQTGFVIYVGLTCVTAIGMNLYAGFGGNYLVDAGEYGYYKTGKDNRAVAMGLGALPMKVALVVGGALGGYGLHLIGYRPGTPAPEGFTRSFMMLLGGVPAVINTVGLLIFSIGYKITDADAAMYAKANQERSMQAQAGQTQGR